MKYIAIPQPAAGWLLTQTRILHGLHDFILYQNNLVHLRQADVAEGPLRMSGSKDGRVLSIWNVDYLSGTGVEQWGLLKLASPFGLNDKPEFSKEVFEREIYIVNQRLQSLLLDSAYHHRTQPNGTQTCMSGRGSTARKFSVCYIESDVAVGNSRTRCLVCVGPGDNFETLSAATSAEGRQLESLVNVANDLLSPHRRRAFLNEEFPTLRQEASDNEMDPTEMPVADLEIVSDPGDVYRTLDWTYNDWIRDDSPLSADQRRILTNDIIERSPLRIMGPGGSGKTLLMQLLAMRRLTMSKDKGIPINVLYIVHNAAMSTLVRERLEILGATEFLTSADYKFRVTTLSEYGKSELGLKDTTVIDVDAHETKQFQLEEITKALRGTLSANLKLVQKSELLSQVASNEDLFGIFARLVMTEISTAIKGHGLVADPQRYIGSEKPLSRLHRLLDKNERELVFKTFLTYHQEVFEGLEVLDSDDIALSLLGKMRTPIWELKRRKLGFDLIFVDETQLFNENERRLFPLLARGVTSHVPIVLALDEAQELYGQSTAGFASLGIKAIANESLPSNFRSTKAIVDLAFYIIQQTTDLFGPDFPDFTGIRAVMEPDDHKLASPPKLEICNSEARSLGRFVVKRIRDLRSMKLMQIAVVCHAEHQWQDLKSELEDSNLPLHILTQRGQRLTPGQPVVVLTRAAYVGGQEFDAVVSVGLEQGVVPPRIHDNDALSMAMEQQALREMYLSFTRARYQLWLVISPESRPTAVIQSAIKAGLVQTG